MQVYLTKTLTGFVPSDQESQEWASKIKAGAVINADFKKTRNYSFLKKWFALLNVGFENWEPWEVRSEYGTPEKNFERFREDVTILAGFYRTTIRLDGSVRVEAKSVSFGKMSEEDFADLYSKTIDVLLKRVYHGSVSEAELNDIVEQYMGFA